MRLESDRREELRKELRVARLAAGLRQVDVARLLGKPQSYVAKIERGDRRVDLIETLDICKVIGLDPSRLVKRLS